MSTSALHYAELGGNPGQIRAPVRNLVNPLKVAAGLASAALMSAGAFASRHLLRFSDVQVGAGGAFVPKNGMEPVLAKPGPPGVLAMLPTPAGTTNALFLYGDQAQDLAGAQVTEGVVYGVAASGHGLASPTGRANEFLTGRLLTWPSGDFAKHLSAADKAMGYDPAKPDAGTVRRGHIQVVQRDGSAVPALWYYKKASPRRFKKIAFVGAGGVGSNTAHLAFQADIADEIALIDITPGSAEATAMDLNHASGVTRSSGRATGTTEMNAVAGADVIVVTAGRARTPGMTRADLIDVNRKVMETVGTAIKNNAPHAVVIVVTNPLDEMTTEMLRITGFPRKQVLGMAGTLDSSRFRNSLATAAKTDPAFVEAITLGSHGDEMVPISSLARIKGQPLSAFLSKEQVEACVKDAVTGGGQVVALKKTGSAVLAPAHATMELLDHLRGAKTGPVPVSVFLEGEFGIKGLVLGVPAILGQGGLQSVDTSLPLSKEEMTALHAAAEAVRTRLASLTARRLRLALV
eukprot:g8927.t1